MDKVIVFSQLGYLKLIFTFRARDFAFVSLNQLMACANAAGKPIYRICGHICNVQFVSLGLRQAIPQL